MTPDRDGLPPAPDRLLSSAAVRPRRELARCGAELVAVSERFYGGVFVAAMLLVGVAALAALVLLPVRPFAPGAPVTAAAILTGLIVAGVPLAVWRAQALYRALRRWPQLQFALVGVAAVLVAHPQMSSELWWPSCAMVMALATVAPPARALTYCLPVLGASLAGHLIAGNLDETPAVAIIGLWIGYPMLVAAMAIVTDRLVAHLTLSLSQPHPRERSREPPRRVRSWMTEPPSSADTPAPGIATDRGEHPASARPPDRASLIERLTARQIQVAALLADGLKQREIAASLSISERQVQRHIAAAVAALGLRNAYELAATAISAGLVSDTPAA